MSDKPGAGSLFLWDIDGTLLRRQPPYHRDALFAAARGVYCVTLPMGYMAGASGMTDHAIARRALRSVGLTDAAINRRLSAYWEAAADIYERSMAKVDLSAYVTPHARETLEYLLDNGASLGLVTGNVERIAWAKLRAAGLVEYFRQPSAPDPMPWIGGFGEQGDEARETLPPIALARATTVLGQAPNPRETWIIGDTPHDITCGQANDLNVIAVATGPNHTLEELQSLNPTYAIADLTQFDALPIWYAQDAEDGAAAE